MSGACGVAATTRLSLRANLAAASPVAREPWHPRADFTLALQANDEQGTLLDFELALRKSSATTWDYHVLFSNLGRTQEVASGALSFNPNGSLRSVITIRPLRFPNRDGGSAGPPIQLAFDADWVFTSFDVASYGGLNPDGAAPHADGCVD